MRIVYRTCLIVAFAALMAFNALGQVPAGAPSSPQPTPTPTPSPEKKFIINILHDQRTIWTSPLHLSKADAVWLAPLGVAAGSLIASDRATSGELVEHGNNQTRLDISNGISQLGAAYTTIGIAASFYVIGRAEDNARARETGLLGAEALIDGAIVSSVLKITLNRPRPQDDLGRGDFLDDGNSFPSGHATAAWSLATVIASEYRQHPVIAITAYGLATAVSVARYTGRDHFLSDSLVGSAIGFGIGRYVYRAHHDYSMDPGARRITSNFPRGKLFPAIAPIYSRGARNYGIILSWSL